MLWGAQFGGVDPVTTWDGWMIRLSAVLAVIWVLVTLVGQALHPTRNAPTSRVHASAKSGRRATDQPGQLPIEPAL